MAADYEWRRRPDGWSAASFAVTLVADTVVCGLVIALSEWLTARSRGAAPSARDVRLRRPDADPPAA